MEYWIYIIYSQVRDRYYVGHTHDLELRLIHHNQGWTKSTKSGIPWILVYSEKYATKSEAIRREKTIKNQKSRSYLESLIKNK